MSFLPLDKKFHPDFAIPGKKPVGGIELDYSNPLTSKLFFVNAPQHRDETLDLVSKSHAGTKSTLSKMVGDFYQQDELSTLDPTIWDIAWPYAALGAGDDSEYTMMWRIRIPDSDGSTAASIFKWGAAEIEIKRFTTSVQLIWAGGVKLTVSGVSDGDIIDIAFNRDSATNDVDQYVDGEYVSTVGGIGNTTFNGCDTIRYHEEADQRGEGIALFYCWVDRKLSASQIMSLHRDPYQILKPVTQTGYFTAAATGATTVNLTGQSVATSQGTLTVTGAASVALTGQTITTGQGIVSVTTGGAISVGLTGQEITLGQGSLSVSGAASVGLTGQTITTGQGVLAAAGAANVTLSGLSSTSALGSVTVTIEATPTVVNLLGQAITVQNGILGLQTANVITLVGQSITVSEGTVTVIGDLPSIPAVGGIGSNGSFGSGVSFSATFGTGIGSKGSL